MSIEKVEQKIIEKMGNLSVESEDDIPFSNYQEFIDMCERDVVNISSRYDTDFVNNFGSVTENILHYILILSPFVISILCIILAFVYSNYWLLFGVPISLISGITMSNPYIMSNLGIGSVLLVFIFIYFCYSIYEGNRASIILSGSYVFPNYFASVGRQQCAMILERVVKKSELIFIWMFKTKNIILN